MIKAPSLRILLQTQSEQIHREKIPKINIRHTKKGTETEAVLFCMPLTEV